MPDPIVPVPILKPPWCVLSMFRKQPIMWDNFLYQNLYKLIYCIAFPSRRDELVKMRISDIHNEELCLKYFESSEKEVVNTLIQVIIKQCREDPLFLSTLRKTRRRKIINNDYNDKYFGAPRNIYGQCLMKVRDEKLYLPLEKRNEARKKKEEQPTSSSSTSPST